METEAQARPAESLTTYQRWQQGEGIPVVRGYYVEDLKALPLAPWRRRGGLGAFINLEGAADIADAYVCEIPPRSSLSPDRHLYEELVYGLQGRGEAIVWQEGGPRQRCRWGEGSLLAIPLNAWYEMANPHDEPARFLAVSSAPLLINLFHNLSFIFNLPYAFRDRYDGEELYFSGEGTQHPGRVWESNFIPDVRSLKLLDWSRRGPGSTNMMFELADNALVAHTSEIPVGRYKKAHRHGPAAHILLLSGRGYSLLWFGDPRWSRGEPRVRVDWKPGTLFVPPNRWFHQHFNTSPQPARYLALRYGGYKHSLGDFFRIEEAVETSVKLGGDQIEYEDEDPEIRRLYEVETARAGVEVAMPPI